MESITMYETHHRHVPARVVVLKTSRFRPEEAEGIDAALGRFGIEMAELKAAEVQVTNRNPERS